MEKLSWGILPGSAHFGLRVLNPLSRTANADIVAVASRDAGRAKLAAARIDAVKSIAAGKGRAAAPLKAHASYQELIDDPAVDAVYISLPNNLHLEWTLKALAAGKHVLCEKPFGMNASEARRASEAASAAGRLVMEAFMYRFHPQWTRAREIVISGEIGSVRSIEGIFAFDNRDPSNIRNRTETGGGAIYDIGCYAVSSARWIMGAEPLRVLCLADRDPGFGTDRLSSGILDFGGARSSFTVSTQIPSFQQVTILGSAGSIRVPLPFNPFPDVPANLAVRCDIGERTIECGPADHYALMFEAFSRAALSGAPAPESMSDAIANMAVLDALFASEKAGAWAKVVS